MIIWELRCWGHYYKDCNLHSGQTWHQETSNTSTRFNHHREYVGNDQVQDQSENNFFLLLVSCRVYHCHCDLLLVVLNPLLLVKRMMMMELSTLPSTQLTIVTSSSKVRDQVMWGSDSSPPSDPELSAPEVFDNIIFWKKDWLIRLRLLQRCKTMFVCLSLHLWLLNWQDQQLG